MNNGRQEIDWGSSQSQGESLPEIRVQNGQRRGESSAESQSAKRTRENLETPPRVNSKAKRSRFLESDDDGDLIDEFEPRSDDGSDFLSGDFLRDDFSQLSGDIIDHRWVSASLARVNGDPGLGIGHQLGRIIDGIDDASRDGSLARSLSDLSGPTHTERSAVSANSERTSESDDEAMRRRLVEGNGRTSGRGKASALLGSGLFGMGKLQMVLCLCSHVEQHYNHA